MFRNREDAGRQLAEALGAIALRDPLVLGIPRGGVVVGGVLARALGAELDAILARKLRAPRQPELAIGAVGEDGLAHVDEARRRLSGADAAYVERECEHQLREIEERRILMRSVRPAASVAGRSVVLVDDGIATGSTMIAAIQIVGRRDPHEVIVAAPVAPPEAIEAFRARCDHVVCLCAPTDFWAIGQFYEDFTQVTDEEVLECLRRSSDEATKRRSD